ncbi:hypothetical protein FB451DRAFT_1558960 [Mycena latifolia]|nr:hypothetical protein FB451DRAFT_1558960 [Mycena latifolia]
MCSQAAYEQPCHRVRRSINDGASVARAGRLRSLNWALLILVMNASLTPPTKKPPSSTAPLTACARSIVYAFLSSGIVRHLAATPRPPPALRVVQLLTTYVLLLYSFIACPAAGRVRPDHPARSRRPRFPHRTGRLLAAAHILRYCDLSSLLIHAPSRPGAPPPPPHGPAHLPAARQHPSTSHPLLFARSRALLLPPALPPPARAAHLPVSRKQLSKAHLPLLSRSPRPFRPLEKNRYIIKYFYCMLPPLVPRPAIFPHLCPPPLCIPAPASFIEPAQLY